MTEYDELKRKSEEYRQLHQRIHETFRCRAESREAWIAWEQACRTFHSYKSPTRFIESADGRQKLREGNPRLLEHAIVFLELDPYMFGSGYAKKAIIRCIKNLPFSESQGQRLQSVVLQALDKFDRPEFRAYCRLAGALHTPEFDVRVRERLQSPDPGTRRRAQELLDYLERRWSNKAPKPGG